MYCLQIQGTDHPISKKYEGGIKMNVLTKLSTCPLY
jgi:hypothetical protein